MSKNKIIHSRMLLQKIKESARGVYFIQSGNSPEIYEIEDFNGNPLTYSSFDYKYSFGPSGVSNWDYLVLYIKGLYGSNRRRNARLAYRQTDGDETAYFGPTRLCWVSPDKEFLSFKKICGGTSTHIGVGIDSIGALYLLVRDTAQRLGGENDYGWTDVSFASSYFYGIKDGKLYKISTDGTLTRIGSSSNWTFLSHGFGVCNGKIYTINNTTLTQISNSSDWKKVYGWGSGGLVLAIKTNDDVCIIRRNANGDVTTKIGTVDEWTVIENPYIGIRNGELYYIKYNFNTDEVKLIQIGTSNKWTALSTLGDFFPIYGICNGVLYGIEPDGYDEDGNNTFLLTEILRNCVGVYGVGKVIAFCNIN